MQVHGPAGTLATSLAKLGWKITVDGTIYTDSMLNLHLLSSPLASILHSTVHTWMKNISQFCLTRPEWRNLPPIDRGSTLKVFMQLPQEQQNTVAKFLTGSYMDANQREHIREGPVTCDICQQDDDTIVHRLLNCPNTQYVRQEHTEVITFLETFDPCYLHLPVVFQDDQVDFNTWFFHQPWEPVINDLVKQQIRLENQQGIRSKIYSDGTCRNPASPSYRRAAFALVFHTCTSIQQCVEIVSQFRTAQKTPSTFQVLSTGACSGFQSIPRAELEAAMVLMQQDLMTTLYTDSQYVVDICDRLGYILDVAQMQSWPNFDILLTIWNHLQLGKTNIVKVKAHDISDKDPPEETFNKIGNHAADTAAKEALKQLDRTTPMHQNFTQHVELLEMAKQQMQFRYHIQVARAKCLQQKDNNHHPQTYVTFQANQERLLELHYDDGIQYDFDDTDQDKLQNSLWGTTISLRILAWLQLTIAPVAINSGGPWSNRNHVVWIGSQLSNSDAMWTGGKRRWNGENISTKTVAAFDEWMALLATGTSLRKGRYNNGTIDWTKHSSDPQTVELVDTFTWIDTWETGLDRQAPNGSTNWNSFSHHCSFFQTQRGDSWCTTSNSRSAGLFWHPNSSIWLTRSRRLDQAN